MPKCIKLKQKHRQVCIGDMRDQIDILTRSLSSGVGVATSATFTTVFSPRTMVETPRSLFIVDEVDGEVQVTHKFTIRFPDAEISSANWIRFETNLYRIIGQTDLEERHEFIELMATRRGAEDKEASNA